MKKVLYFVDMFPNDDGEAVYVNAYDTYSAAYKVAHLLYATTKWTTRIKVNDDQQRSTLVKIFM